MVLLTSNSPRMSFPILIVLYLTSFISSTFSKPTSVPFTTCTSSSLTGGYLFNISSIFAQITPADEAAQLGLVGGIDGKRVLRLNLFGATGEEFVGYNNLTGKLATMFSSTSDLTFSLYETVTYVCNSLFPESPLPTPYYPHNTTYCPLDPGPIGINLSIPLNSGYPLTTLTTNIRIVDRETPPNELLCLSLDLSPYYPKSTSYRALLWIPISLAIGVWITTWAGRFAAGWAVGSMGQEAGGGEVGWGKKGGLGRKWGTMIVSGLSGERVGVSGGLLRFITPGLRDVLWYLQFIAMLGMVSVNWPGFAYPIVAQSAWASLIWNVTLVQGHHSDLNNPEQFDPSKPSTQFTIPSGFADQVTDIGNPLYLDDSIENVFLNLNGATNGMESFAHAVGLRDQDLFGTCAVIFLLLAAGIIAISLMVWTLHGFLTYFISGDGHDLAPSGTRGLNSAASSTTPIIKTPKRNSSGYAPELLSGSIGDRDSHRDSKYLTVDLGNDTPSMEGPMLSPQTGQERRFGGVGSAPGAGRPSAWKRAWWRFKVKGPVGAFHWSALCGNLVRIIMLFHLPLTTFSVYQWTIRDHASLASVVLAAISFTVFSVLLPVVLLLKVSVTPTGKLFDATRTLLSLGPLYNVYKPGSQLFPALLFASSLASGIVVGAGQKSGTAQAIILLVIEITTAVVTTVWQPWGGGSGMAVPGFLFSLFRVVSAVLLMILSPAIALGAAPRGWVAYIILGLQGVALILFIIMLLFKILEGLIRLFGNVRFDESKHPLDGGLFAAFGGLRGKKARAKKGKQGLHRSTSSGAGSVNTQMMLDRHSTTTTPNPYGPGNQYFPSNRPLSNGSDYEMGPGIRPNSYLGLNTGDAREEMLADNTSPQRGFSVVRGGKANYEDPYDAVPRQDGQPGRTGGSSQQSHGGSSSSHGPGRQNTRHARTRSQTAIVETLPGSTNPSPTANYPPLPIQGPGYFDPYATGSSRTKGPPPPLQKLALANLRDADRFDQQDSPTSAYSSENPSPQRKKPSKPSTWFGKSSRKAGAEWSDSDDETSGMEDFGPRGGGRKADTEPKKGKGASGGWLSALKPSGKGKEEPVDEKRMDENAQRKSLMDQPPPSAAPSANTFASGSEPKRSFQVNRAPRSGAPSFKSGNSGGDKTTPVPSLPVTPSGPNFAQNEETSAVTPKSFVVSRPNQAGHQRTGSNPSIKFTQESGRAATPPTAAATQAATSPPTSYGRSFVVSRPQQQQQQRSPPSQQSRPPRPLSGSLQEPVEYTPLTGGEDLPQPRRPSMDMAWGAIRNSPPRSSNATLPQVELGPEFSPGPSSSRMNALSPTPPPRPQRNTGTQRSFEYGRGI